MLEWVFKIFKGFFAMFGVVAAWNAGFPRVRLFCVNLISSVGRQASWNGLLSALAIS